MPASYSCPWHMERVGRMGDGGKWVCGMQRYEEFPVERECVVYSFGVRDESSFGELPCGREVSQGDTDADDVNRTGDAEPDKMRRVGV
jgi:methyltransferase family protein